MPRVKVVPFAFINYILHNLTGFVDQEGELLEQLKTEKFDLFIGEQINFCGSGLSHLLGIPVHVLLVRCVAIRQKRIRIKQRNDNNIEISTFTSPLK